MTDAPLDTRHDPRELHLPAGRAAASPSACSSATAASWPGWPRSATPVLLLENDGVQVCGTSVLDAFDRLEVLESTAEAMINSRPLGAMVPMSDEAIAELDAAFAKAE